jgi:hypothetical protein
VPVTVYAQRELWRERHRFCTDHPPEMSFAEARFVLGEHAGHGGTCRQFAAALCRVSQPLT